MFNYQQTIHCPKNTKSFESLHKKTEPVINRADATVLYNVYDTKTMVTSYFWDSVQEKFITFLAGVTFSRKLILEDRPRQSCTTPESIIG